MSTFRVNKNVNYTVMSNHHLQDKRLSLKAKGLLSYMLSLPQTDDSEPLGKYGRMRLAYLKTQRPVLYNKILLNGTLWPHLQDVQRVASEQVERTIAALADKFPTPDKERAQFLWVTHMNGLKAQAEEMVVREVVYAE